MTETARPYRYIDADNFCLSARLLPDLNNGGVTDTLSITIEGSDEPQSVHVSAADAPAVAAGIVRAAGLPPASAGVAPATDQKHCDCGAPPGAVCVHDLAAPAAVPAVDRAAEAEERVARYLFDQDWTRTVDHEAARQLLAVLPDTSRAAVLREAADDLAEFIALHGPTSRTVTGWRGAVMWLCRMAAEAQPAAELRRVAGGEQHTHDDYQATTGHAITCLAVAGGAADPDCPCAGGEQNANTQTADDDAEHVDGCPGCIAFTPGGHTAASAGPAAPDTEASPRTVCVCGHTRAEHLTVSGRLLCDVCDPDSAENLTCTGFEAL